MTSQRNHRLAHKADCLFSGRLIERDQPISFTLNAREIKAFRGDTILSALLAAGVDVAGQVHDEPIALDPSLSLTVFGVGTSQDPGFALPIERTRAIDGMELVTPATGLISSWTQKSRLAALARALPGLAINSLDYNLNAGMALPDYCSGMAESSRQSVDLVVVGGGVAGMSAALKASQKGWRVALIEQRPVLGGDAQFFGPGEGEQRPTDLVSDLETGIKQPGGVSVFVDTLALSISQGMVRAHQVCQEGNEVATRLIVFETKKIIIAVGTFERLPVFAGNRLPGVVGSRTAFHLAASYGVWRGNSAAFCTASSAATRVALLAADLGVIITKLADSRLSPKSRFFEFAKAYGVSLATGTRVEHAQIGKRGDLSVKLGLSGDFSGPDMDSIMVDRLVVCGGWQPDLSLWNMAGGETKWDNAHQQLRASKRLENIALAGSAAGATGMSQCASSGVAAFFDLTGQAHDPDPKADNNLPAYESGDGALPVGETSPDMANCYLDSATSFARPSVKPASGFVHNLVAGRRGQNALFDVSERALSLNDVVAKIALGEIKPGFANVIAQERCCPRSRLAGQENSNQSLFEREEKTSRPPAYLDGRFGQRATSVVVTASEIDRFEVGCLIYPDTRQTAPGQAIGAIFAVPDDGSGQALALLDLSQLANPRQAIVRNDSHTIEVGVKAFPRPRPGGGRRRGPV